MLLFLVAGIGLAAAGISYFLITSRPASAAWFDERWLYRQAVRITNPNGSNLSDFQVSFTLDTASLISSGKMQSDCDDIRIIDPSGKKLNYWIEDVFPGCNNASTKIWVKVPTVFNGTNATLLHLYYGNSSATSESNASNVMDRFEGFEDGTTGLLENQLNESYFSITSEVVSSGTYSLQANDVSGSLSGGMYANQDTYWDEDQKTIDFG